MLEAGFPMGGEPLAALDLVDTLMTAVQPPRDVIEDREMAERWWALEAGRLPDAPRPEDAAALRLRAALRDLFDSHLEEREPQAASVADVNAFAASVPTSAQLAVTPTGPEAAVRWHTEHGQRHPRRYLPRSDRVAGRHGAARKAPSLRQSLLLDVVPRREQATHLVLERGLRQQSAGGPALPQDPGREGWRRVVTVHDTGFHDGEREVQIRAGVREEAARLEGMLAPAGLRGGSAHFLAAQAFAVLVARDQEGGLWASPLIARPGFLRGQDRVLAVHASPDPGDPLHGLRAGQDVAVIAPDLERRRRVRVNGRLTGAGTNGLTIEVDQAYGNCPSYIRQRAVTAGPGAEEHAMFPALDEDGVLTPKAARIVTSSDTFFLGSQHPDRGADASHKGGDPGFVRVEGADVVWPDYAGNNMFNSLGNLAVDPPMAPRPPWQGPRRGIGRVVTAVRTGLPCHVERGSATHGGPRVVRNHRHPPHGWKAYGGFGGGTSITLRTPDTANARVASKRATFPPTTGGRAMTAVSIPGILMSAP